MVYQKNTQTTPLNYTLSTNPHKSSQIDLRGLMKICGYDFTPTPHFIFTRKKKLVDAPKRLRPKVGIARALRRAYRSFRREDSAMTNPKGAQASARRAPSPPPFGITVNLTLPSCGAAVLSSPNSPTPPLTNFSATSISNTFKNVNKL